MVDYIIDKKINAVNQLNGKPFISEKYRVTLIINIVKFTWNNDTDILSSCNHSIICGFTFLPSETLDPRYAVDRFFMENFCVKD